MNDVLYLQKQKQFGNSEYDVFTRVHQVQLKDKKSSFFEHVFLILHRFGFGFGIGNYVRNLSLEFFNLL